MPLDLSFIVRPQTENLNGLLFFIDLINKAVLDVDAAAVCTVQITHQLFVRGRVLERINTNDFNERLCLFVQMGRLQFWHVLCGGFGVNDLVHLPLHRRFVHTVLKRRGDSVHNLFAHTRCRDQIQRFHDAAVIFFRQQYGIAVKESRGQLSYLPAGRTKFIRAKHLGDKFDKAAVLATLQANAERKPKVQFKQDTIGKLIDIQSRMTEGKGIGYKRWLTKHNLKVMAQTVKLLQEKGLTDEVALDQRIAALDTKYHDSLTVVKDLETRMADNKTLRRHAAAYTSTKNIAQQLKAAKRPAAFEEQHRAELTAYRAAAAYFKANNTTKLPSPKKLEAEYAQLASEKAKFYEQYKESKEELLKLKTAKQNVASFFREEEQTQQER